MLRTLLHHFLQRTQIFVGGAGCDNATYIDITQVPLLISQNVNFKT